MILVDANLLLYAKLADTPQHPAAHRWLDAQLNGASRVGLPWESLTAFLRISTNPRIFPNPMPIAIAWRQVQEWVDLPTVWIPIAGESHAQLLGKLLHETSASANHVPDAHLAALAMGHGATLCSADADFRRYRGLKLLNPLEAPPR